MLNRHLLQKIYNLINVLKILTDQKLQITNMPIQIFKHTEIKSIIHQKSCFNSCGGESSFNILAINIPFVFHKRKKVIQVLKRHKGWVNNDRIFIFGWTIFIKHTLQCVWEQVLVLMGMKPTDCKRRSQMKPVNAGCAQYLLMRWGLQHSAEIHPLQMECTTLEGAGYY